MESGEKRYDLIDILIELKKNNNNEEIEGFKFDGNDLVAQAASFFSAGFDTSAIPIAFTLYELALQPEIPSTLRKELVEALNNSDGNITYDMIMSLSYLDMVVLETLRKYPPFGFLSRIAMQDYKVPNSNLVLKKGTPVYIPMLGLHYDPKYFPDPDKYDPERFNEKNKCNIPACVYFPFGDGPHMCIGTRLGYLLMKFTLIKLLNKYEVAPCKKTTIPVIIDPTISMTSPLDGYISTYEKLMLLLSARQLATPLFITWLFVRKTVPNHLKMWLTNTDNKGPCLNYGSYKSGIHVQTHANILQTLRNKLYPTKLPEFTPKLKSRGRVHQSDVSEGWSVPLGFIPDGPLVLRTQRFLYDKYKQRPAQVQLYATIPSFFELLLLSIVVIMLSLMTRIEWSRKLILKYPSLFTLGFISDKNPNLEAWKSITISFTMRARGWTEMLAEPTNKYTNPPNKEVITKVSVVSPAYETTSIMTILSAITILNETDIMPDNGGVLTPGAAFGKTSLVERMNKHNIKFEVISSTVK
ncbi:PREDICTED: probable mitochondrial saccharopine dehydrogenase-like oxidoreductase At5g39410 [Vollenhovia emeryi]|uniref:probable mitochondrial saccharopine dehydrogenase-like oxidoreductase At5g39410 n=1 Tax=Vollenhovia emeryi TaxID=411798 RepID=UPI0005F3EFBD|nr:PREDICTED: probable mitochondrial saccharopine dehydrogenase-like oxidoreductase At5g39410 [Vollenhovia emeryi]